MSVVQGTPLSEYGSNIASNEFTTLFLTGRGGFDEPRDHKVSEKDWANYLLQLLRTHVFNTGHSTQFYVMSQRRLQGGFRPFSRVKIHLQQHR